MRPSDDNPGNDVPYPLYLPAYTAAAHFHKKLPPDLQADLPKALAEARAFAKGEYAAALQQGDALSADEHKKIAAELARLTGLKPQVIEDNHLRIDEGVFRKQLLHDEGLILGAYDARITGRDDDPASPDPDFDPVRRGGAGAVFGGDEHLRARRIEIRGRSALRNPRRRAAVELRRAQQLRQRGRQARRR